MNIRAQVSNMAATILLCLATQAVGQSPPADPGRVIVDPDGVVHVPPFALPLSPYMSDEAKRAFVEMARKEGDAGSPSDIVAFRKAIEHMYAPVLARTQARYRVTIRETTIGGVHVYDVTPATGVAEGLRDSVLINIHGGAFMLGSHGVQLLESIPIAAVTGRRVISVDYRLAPEARFPAASIDVANVYKELLRQYRPEAIGIYGSSAGGAITGMAVAWFQKHGLPRPGAVAILSPGDALSAGDSRYTATPTNIFTAPPPASPNPPPMPVSPAYFIGADVRDPLVSPFVHPDVLAQFPPTMLVSGTRDFLASATIEAHRQLVKANVPADLHMWDGMWHAFYLDSDIAESREMYEVMANFFAAHLGRKDGIRKR